MSWSYYTKEAFAIEFDQVINLSSEIMYQKNVLSLSEFKNNTAESFDVIFPSGEMDKTRLFEDLKAYYMVYLTKNWLERSSENHTNTPSKPANKSSERPYLRLVR